MEAKYVQTQTPPHYTNCNATEHKLSVTTSQDGSYVVNERRKQLTDRLSYQQSVINNWFPNPPPLPLPNCKSTVYMRRQDISGAELNDSSLFEVVNRSTLPFSVSHYKERNDLRQHAKSRIVSTPYVQFLSQSQTSHDFSPCGNFFTILNGCAPYLKGNYPDLDTYTSLEQSTPGLGKQWYHGEMQSLYMRLIQIAIGEGHTDIVIPPIGMGIYLKGVNKKTQEELRKQNLLALQDAITAVRNSNGTALQSAFHIHINSAPTWPNTFDRNDYIQGLQQANEASQVKVHFFGVGCDCQQMDAIEYTCKCVQQQGSKVAFADAGADNSLGGEFEKHLSENAGHAPPIEEAITGLTTYPEHIRAILCQNPHRQQGQQSTAPNPALNYVVTDAWGNREQHAAAAAGAPPPSFLQQQQYQQYGGGGGQAQHQPQQQQYPQPLYPQALPQQQPSQRSLGDIFPNCQIAGPAVMYQKVWAYQLTYFSAADANAVFQQIPEKRTGNHINVKVIGSNVYITQEYADYLCNTFSGLPFVPPSAAQSLPPTVPQQPQYQPPQFQPQPPFQPQPHSSSQMRADEVEKQIIKSLYSKQKQPKVPFKVTVKEHNANPQSQHKRWYITCNDSAKHAIRKTSWGGGIQNGTGGGGVLDISKDDLAKGLSHTGYSRTCKFVTGAGLFAFGGGGTYISEMTGAKAILMGITPWLPIAAPIAFGVIALIGLGLLLYGLFEGRCKKDDATSNCYQKFS